MKLHILSQFLWYAFAFRHIGDGFRISFFAYAMGSVFIFLSLEFLIVIVKKKER